MYEVSSTLQPRTRQSPAAKLICRTAYWILDTGALLLLFFSCPMTPAQISPGPLARAHQSLSGNENCTKCHELSTSAPTFRCLECHREIAEEIQLNKGLHATFPRLAAPGASCVKCHSDHNGADFQMVHWTPTEQGFDHGKTGFVLEGKHTGVSCRACHTAQHISARARVILAGKDLNQTWLGLSTSCGSCHRDVHEGRFGSNCASCHSTADWKTAEFDTRTFDHSRTPFPLTGEHRRVACNSCHTPGEDGRPRYEGLKFAYCADCHRDPHKREFKQSCEECHNTTSWTQTDFVQKFDHSKTSFPLRGKHQQVPCLKCHEGGDFKTPIAHTSCADCHKPDPHGGQFAQRADGGRCESCHNDEGWSPSTFSVADHAKTGFPLVFPHQKVACALCHVPEGNKTRFKLSFALCTDCHRDEHGGQFAGAPWRNHCEKCHDGPTFKTSSYTLEKHQRSDFPLTGGHEAVPCNQCHKPATGSQVTLYHFGNLSCTTCHEDVHKGQFAQRMAVLGGAGKPLGCLACHSTTEWKDLAKFDHSRTGFPLLGSHRAATCAECHRPPNLELTMVHVRFAEAPTRCSGCHENPHAGQFGQRADDCAGCHDTNKWRPSLFDHDSTAFPLKGGHENVACSACHTLRKPVAGKLVLFYKPTPTRCEACHGSTVPAAGAHKS
jgi:hypothetical protein